MSVVSFSSRQERVAPTRSMERVQKTPAASSTGESDSFGLKLGKLSVSITTERSSPSREGLAAEARKRVIRDQAQAFNLELEIEELRQTMGRGPFDDRVEPRSTGTPLKRGVQTYAQMEKALETAPLRIRSNIGVV